MLRILPGDIRAEKKPVAVIFELSGAGDSYTKKTEFPLVNRWMPVDACISDAADVFTFDDWGMMGHEHVMVWYSRDGKTKGDYALSQLLPGKQLAEVVEQHRSVSSIHWRRNKPYLNGPYLVIPDALGGYVSFSEGVFEYAPREER